MTPGRSLLAALVLVMVVPFGLLQAQPAPPAPALGPWQPAQQAAPVAGPAPAGADGSASPAGWAWFKDLCNGIAGRMGSPAQYSEPSYEIFQQTAMPTVCVLDLGGQGQIKITAEDSAESASGTFDAWAQRGQQTTGTGLGDRAVLVERFEDMAGNQTPGIVFVHSCFFVVGSWGASNEAAVRGALEEISQTITGKSCARGPAAVAPSTQTGAMTLGLSCDANLLQAQGRLLCNAGLTNVAPDAQITYSWTVDGAPRAATGAELPEEALAVGPHTVSVRARDAVTGAEAGPETRDVTRYPVGAAPPVGSDPFARALPPLVAGSAIAIAIALAALARRRARGRTPGQPTTAAATADALGAAQPWKPERAPPRSRPGETLGEAPATPPRQPPSSRPFENLTAPASLAGERPAAGANSSPDQRDARKDPPTIDLELVLPASVLCRSLLGSPDPQILGDDADILMAGFKLTIGPPGKWQVNPARPRHGTRVVSGDYDFASVHAITTHWTITNGRFMPVECAGTPGTGEHWQRAVREGVTVPSDERNIFIFSNWTDTNQWLTVKLAVEVAVSSLDGQPNTTVPAEATGRVLVRGANSRATAELTGDGQIGRDQAAQSGNAVELPATGDSWVRVEPQLELFGTAYLGGIRIVEPIERIFAATPDPAAGDHDKMSDFLAATRETPRGSSQRGSVIAAGDSAARTETLSLRCKARFADPAYARLPGQGCPVRLVIEPTGFAWGLEQDIDAWDWVLKLHYRRCAERYFLGAYDEQAVLMRAQGAGSAGVLLTEPGWVRLQPLTGTVAAPSPSLLPRTDGTHPPYTAILKVRIETESGVAFHPGHMKDLADTGIRQLMVRVWYDPPQEEWRRKIDPGRRRDAPVRIIAEGVGEDGFLQFGGKRELAYHHLDHFTLDVQQPQSPPAANGGWQVLPDKPGEWWHYVGGQTCDIHFAFGASGVDPHGDAIDIVSPARQISIAAADKKKTAVSVRVLAQSNETLEAATIIPYVDGIAGAAVETDHAGRATLAVECRGDGDLELQVAYQTTPAFGDSAPAITSDWPLSGTRERDRGVTVTRRFRAGLVGEREPAAPQEFTMPVSTQWALQTDLAVSLSFDAKKIIAHLLPEALFLPGLDFIASRLSAGGSAITAFLINRAVYPKGDLPGGIRELLTWHAPPDLNAWRRIALVFGQASGGISTKFFNLPVNAEISEPGATEFQTRFPVAFEDFHQRMGFAGTAEGVVPLQVSAAGLNTSKQELIEGKSLTYVQFTTMTVRPRVIDVSSYVVSATFQLSAGFGGGLWLLFDGDQLDWAVPSATGPVGAGGAAPKPPLRPTPRLIFTRA